MMKNLSLILNIVLLLAVGVLFYWHFADNGDVSSSGNGEEYTPTEAKVVYVRSDSILEHYDYFKAQRDQLQEKSKKLEQEYRNRAQGLQNDINDYQRTINNLTLSQAKALEEDLGKKQQNLKLYEQSITQDLMNDQNELNQELYDRVTAFLKKYGHQRGLHYVLKFDPTSDLLFAGDSLDITDEVIDGLNKEYQNEKGATKEDSTKVKKK